MSSLPPSSAVFVDNDDSRTSSSSSSQASLSHFLTQNQSQNPSQNQTDQTIEDTFARLSFSHFDFNHPHPPFVANDPYASNTHSFENPMIQTPQRSNLYGLTNETNAVNAANSAIGGLLPPQNSWVLGNNNDIERESVNWNTLLSGYYPALIASGYSPRNSNGFLDSEPLVRQTGFGVGLLNNGFDVSGRSSNSGSSSSNSRSPHWLSNLKGRVVALAKDQNGCRDLISIMKRLTVTSSETSFIFHELIDHVAELMVEPFGNYVVQKLVEICDEDQRTLIILRVIQPNLLLVRICLNPHGTRAVEKLLEHVTTQQQRSLVMSALIPGAGTLATDSNGHRVLLHCLKYFSPDDNMNLLRVVANLCFGIATDKTGCCVLQQCVNYAHGETKKQLLAEIIVNAPLLAEDAYGNYVVQHLVSPKTPIVTECLLRQLEGKFLSLSRNKYGSNVVEKFFQEAGELYKRRIILELLHNPDVARLLVDPFGNYVIQSAIMVSKGAIQDALLHLIQLNSPIMRTNVYGRKLLEKFGSGGRLRRSS